MVLNHSEGTSMVHEAIGSSHEKQTGSVSTNFVCSLSVFLWCVQTQSLQGRDIPDLVADRSSSPKSYPVQWKAWLLRSTDLWGASSKAALACLSHLRAPCSAALQVQLEETCIQLLHLVTEILTLHVKKQPGLTIFPL